MGAADKGFRKSYGETSETDVQHDQAKVDEEHHGWAPDADAGVSAGAKERTVEGHKKAFDPAGTQEASRGDATEDPSAPPPGVGESQTRRGEDIIKDEGQEAGRKDLGTKGESQRPYGTVEAGEGVGVKPSKPIDPAMPDVQTGDQGG
jgi:hypothetical protein